MPTSLAPPDPGSRRLGPPWRDEAARVRECTQALAGLDWDAVTARARPWIAAVRASPPPFWALESLLREYPLGTDQGLALLRLAEALLRVPDTATAALLAADQLGRAARADAAQADHVLASRLLAVAAALLPDDAHAGALISRLGAPAVVAIAVRAVSLLGRQFVLGETFALAAKRAEAMRGPQLRFSYDMLGEGARSAADADRHLAGYLATIRALGAGGAARRGARLEDRDAVSVKLSALHPRFEALQRGRVFAELLPRLELLAREAAAAGVGLTVDAEESERLELQLDLIDAVCSRLGPGWEGFGLALQAYQVRAGDALGAVVDVARSCRVRLWLRLVKGAYWDAEIKRAQELGLESYPVHTRREHTEVSYLACARGMFRAAEAGLLFPQFGSHNAATVAAVRQLATEHPGVGFELQRLHGMGEELYREVLRERSLSCRVYAPVGAQRDLLAYLARRLLENGANVSFVRRLADPAFGVEGLLVDPRGAEPTPGLAPPRAVFGRQHGRVREAARGVDLADGPSREPLLAAVRLLEPHPVAAVDAAAADAAMRALGAAFPAWEATPPAQRAAILLRAAELFEARAEHLIALLVREAHKTLGDAVAELRETVDACRYHALEALHLLEPRVLPGPTGERNALQLRGRGVVVCISPWNFPLAIFTAQVAAALVCGNTVAAKPAEQTPACAEAAVGVLRDAGVPPQVLALLPGTGGEVGAALAAHPLAAGVAFTGSTAVARSIARATAAGDGALPMLIAETGGVNAMVVDSTALPEQVVDAVLASAFRSAGQRCSALRLLCLQDDVADTMIEAIVGAMRELRIGHPADPATDVGPVIDAEAWDSLRAHLARLRGSARPLGATPWPPELSASAQPGADALGLRCREPALAPWAGRAGRMLHFVAPCLFEIGAVESARDEVFGPVLQVVRWPRGGLDALVDRIRGLGWGLTLGIQTRIESRAERIAARAGCGNVYVNRSMIGAVVGSQPFGGRGLSGTGPKAGGPHYLPRFCSEVCVSVNTAAAGGDAVLMARGES